MSFQMSAQEKRATFDLSRIFAFRMLGLFMILPIFSLYADRIDGATPLMIGIALGIYGLASAIFQAPLGMLSDRFGRKQVISVGLIVFCIGSLVAARAHSMDGIIVGRFLQGAGAVGSTLLALLADSTRDEVRFKAMSVMGMTIGLSFVVAMVAGPILNVFIGLSGIFYFTAALAVIGLILLWWRVPNVKTVFHRDQGITKSEIAGVLKDKQLLRLDFGIICLHAILTATFVVLPVALVHSAGLAEKDQWYVYLPVLIISFIVMVPFIIIGEKKRMLKGILSFAVLFIALSEVGLYFFHQSVWSVGVLLVIFFTAFTLLEASLPSLVSKMSKTTVKGTAMGIYSSSQFLGIFIGGAVAGYLYGHGHPADVYIFCAVVAVVWLLAAVTMKQPAYVATRMIQLGDCDTVRASQIQAELQALPGVAEVAVLSEDQTAYLKVDSAQFDEKNILKYSVNFTKPE